MKIGIIPRLALAVACVAAVGFGLGGCTTAVPALSECAATTNGGFGSSGQGITSVVHPGDQVQVGSGDTAWYWPCNDRNFVTATTGGDRTAPEYAVRTAASGTTPGMPVYVWTSVYFTPNQNDSVMKQFLPFCLKYGCADTEPQSSADIANTAHSSSPGWEKMLLENIGPAVDRASRIAVQQFTPSLWQDQASWDKLSGLIAKNLNAQLSVETEASVPFFCGSGSSQGNCTQMTVVVNNVTPADPSVGANYNKEVAAEQAAAANAARVAAAKDLYGPFAYYALMLQDEASNCPKCTIVVGNPNTIPTAAGK
jgi:hypothetical protein